MFSFDDDAEDVVVGISYRLYLFFVLVDRWKKSEEETRFCGPLFFVLKM